MNKQNSLTEGSVLKSLIRLSIPIILANVLQSAYQLIDTFWVGRLGETAVAAVSLSFPIIFFIISLGGGLAMAGTILVAQYKGREDAESINYITSQTVFMVLITSFILATIGYLISPIVVDLVGAQTDVYNSAVSYLKISFIGMVFVFNFMVFQSLMRGVGNVKAPLFIVGGTVLLNLILDPLFIFGYGVIPGFGVAGAAVATIGTQGIASLIAICMLLKGKYGIKLSFKDMKLDMPLMKKMFRIGIPASIEQSTRALGMTIMTFLVTSFGTATLAAYGIGTNVLGFIIIPALGLSMSTSTLVGQNIGAGKKERARKVMFLSSISGFIFLTVIGALTFIFSDNLAGFFIPGETDIIHASSLFIKIMSFSFGFIGIQMALNGGFRGVGNTLIPMILSIVSIWVLRFPLAYILSLPIGWGDLGIWAAFPIANVISAVAVIIFYKVGYWDNSKAIEEIRLIKETTKEVMIESGR